MDGMGNSLRTRAACASGLLAAAVLAAAMWPLLAGDATAGGRMRMAMESAAAKIDAGMLVRQRALARAADQLSQGASASALTRHSVQQGLSFMFEEVCLLGTDGKLIASTDAGQGQCTDRAFLKQALGMRQPAVSAPVHDKTRREWSLVMTTPVFDAQRRPVAVLGGRLNLTRQHVFAAIDEAVLPAQGRLALTTHDGATLAPDMPSQGSSAAHGERVWHVFMQLANVDWIVSATLPLDALSQPASLRWQLLGCAIAGVLALMLLVWLAMGRWLEPARRLRAGMEAMLAEPQMHFVAEVARRDEIGQLADTFNKLMHARSHAVQGLIAEKEWVAVTLNSIADAVVTTDDLGIVEYLNRVAEELTGWRSDEARGKALSSVLHIEDEQTKEPASLLEKALAESRGAGAVRQYILMRRDGSTVPIDESAAPIRDADGQLRGLVFVFRDVTQQRKFTNRARWDAEHDALTGLVNRRAFEDGLSALIRNAGKRRMQSCLLLLDLDHFKQVNDTGGHAAGDALLKQIAKLMQGKVRSVDLCARLGGDEFAIVLQNCPQQEALNIAHKIRKAIHDLQFIWNGETFRVGVSIGAALITHETVTMRQAMQQADEACYQSKAAGRNQVALYDSGVVAASGTAA